MTTKIMVQHRETKACVSCGEMPQWTEFAARARLFETPYHALHYCVDRDVQNADVVLDSPGGRKERFLALLN